MRLHGVKRLVFGEFFNQRHIRLGAGIGGMHKEHRRFGAAFVKRIHHGKAVLLFQIFRLRFERGILKNSGRRHTFFERLPHAERQFRGSKGSAPNIKKIIFPADCFRLNIQNIAPNKRKLFFHPTFRRHIGALGHIRFRHVGQRRAVYFAVGVERNSRDLQNKLRHHIRGQGVFNKPFEVLRVQFFAGYHIRRHMFAAVFVFLHHYGAIFQKRVFAQTAFNFA